MSEFRVRISFSTSETHWSTSAAASASVPSRPELGASEATVIFGQQRGLEENMQRRARRVES
jgi:hypothetical protein